MLQKQIVKLFFKTEKDQTHSKDGATHYNKLRNQYFTVQHNSHSDTDTKQQNKPTTKHSNMSFQFDVSTITGKFHLQTIPAIRGNPKPSPASSASASNSVLTKVTIFLIEFNLH